MELVHLKKHFIDTLPPSEGALFSHSE